MAGLRCALASTSTTALLLSVVLFLAVIAPAQAWMNETRSIRRCNITLSTTYTPTTTNLVQPLELDNATNSALFQAHLRQWWVERIASSTPTNPPGFRAVSFDEFVNTLRAVLYPVIEDVDNGDGTTSRRLTRADVHVEGSFEVEQYNCGYAVGTMDMDLGILSWSVTWSAHLTLFGQPTDVVVRLRPYDFGVVDLDERTYTVLVPTEEDLCTIRFEGSYQLGFPLDRDVVRPDATVVFREEVDALVRLTFAGWNFGFGVAPIAPDQLIFFAGIGVLKNESAGLTSLLAPAVMRTLERYSDAPYDSSEMRIKPSRACYVPPPVWTARCVQVSAKLESGAPFALNSSAVNSSSVIFASFRNALNRAMGDQSVVFGWNLQVQSVAAVPLEQADTLQVAVRVDFEIDQKDEAKGVSTIGRQVASALETTAVEVSPSSLYEVAYTITPCHSPSTFSS